MRWPRGRFITRWPEPEEPVVYFVAAGGLVKIGHAGNLFRRLNELSTMSAAPLLLEGWLPGYTGLEFSLHKTFADLRTHGEWFMRGQRLVAFLNRLQNGIDCDAARRDFAAQFYEPRPCLRGKVALC